MTAKVSRIRTRDYVLEDPIRLTPVDEARNRLYRRWAARSLAVLLSVTAVVATLRLRRTPATVDGALPRRVGRRPTR